MAYARSGDGISLQVRDIDPDSASGRALSRAVDLLERHGFAARLAEHAGQPLSKLLNMLPGVATAPVNAAVQKSLGQCLHWAIHSMGETPSRPSRWRSTAMVGLSGGVGGALGWMGLPFELPLTTTLMLRGIADIARHQGEDLTQPASRLACMEVFALGGGRKRDARTDIGYWATRAMFSRLAGQATSFAIERGVGTVAMPFATQFVTEIAARYGIVVSEKIAAGSLPVIGAFGGATINMMFMDHFQKIAEGHFIVRRLERAHGNSAVEASYARLARQRRGVKV